MRVFIHDDQAPLDVRISVERDDGEVIAVMRTGGRDYERMRDALRVRLLADLRSTLAITLGTRFAHEARHVMRDSPPRCEKHGVDLAFADDAESTTRCGCPLAHADIPIVMRTELLRSIVDEAARNTAQAILGLIDLIEEA